MLSRDFFFETGQDFVGFANPSFAREPARAFRKVSPEVPDKERTDTAE
jgi:hypothetical protein